jgi:hypothetical protein
MIAVTVRVSNHCPAFLKLVAIYSWLPNNFYVLNVNIVFKKIIFIFLFFICFETMSDMISFRGETRRSNDCPFFKKNIKENCFKSVKALKVIAILTAYL